MGTGAVPDAAAVGDSHAALLRDVMDRIGDKWSVTVICRLDAGPLRFNALKRATDGITQRMLSATVRRLERDGLISRTVEPTTPPRVEYALTARGRSLHGVLAGLVDWTERNLDDIRRDRAAYDEAGSRARSSAGSSPGGAAASWPRPSSASSPRPSAARPASTAAPPNPPTPASGSNARCGASAPTTSTCTTSTGPAPRCPST
ncbi:helix-turn-helix domain-containing protein [Streptomyces sp. NPDC047002]|uniref:winged helix-turn-helix transcriptional regulator n=1 Tax=Streptomyces sp. NPDC047002 TaxID=3155475 RepID=UPI003455112E